MNDASAFRIPGLNTKSMKLLSRYSSPSHEFHLHSFPLFSSYWSSVIAWNLSPVADVTRVEDPFSEDKQYYDKYTKHDRIQVVITKLRLQSPLLRWHWYYRSGWCVQYSVFPLSKKELRNSALRACLDNWLFQWYTRLYSKSFQSLLRNLSAFMLLFDHPSSKCWPHTGQTVGCPGKK